MLEFTGSWWIWRQSWKLDTSIKQHSWNGHVSSRSFRKYLIRLWVLYIYIYIYPQTQLLQQTRGGCGGLQSGHSTAILLFTTGFIFFPFRRMRPIIGPKETHWESQSHYRPDLWKERPVPCWPGEAPETFIQERTSYAFSYIYFKVLSHLVVAYNNEKKGDGLVATECIPGGTKNSEE